MMPTIRMVSILFILAIPCVAHAQDKTLAPCYTLLGADYMQTLSIKNHDGIEETNRIMGPNPGDDTVTEYFLGVAAIYSVIDFRGPEWLRTAARIFCISTHGLAVQNNTAIGLSVRF